MAIPAKDFLIKPLQNTEMKYNLKLQQYVLEYDYAIHETALGDLVVDYDGRENVEWYLEWVSRTAYTYIRSFKDSKFQERLTYYLSHSRRSREAIKRLMLDILFYTEQEGGLFMAYVTGINLQEAKNITDISLKTAVGMVGDQIVKNYGLATREFEYDFAVVPSTAGSEW